jgi:hypothetical protein
MTPMAPLGASRRPGYPLRRRCRSGGEIAGVWRFGEEWIALSEGPDRDYLDASGRYPD